MDELKLALSYAHSKNKKIFVTVKKIIKESEYDDAINYLNDLYEAGVDGVILQDYSLILEQSTIFLLRKEATL